MRISDWSSDVCSSDLIEADQPRAIARGKFGKPADRDHRVEQGHVGAIGQRRWLLGGADDADLLAERAREILDDHRDDRLLDILAERDLHVIGERSEEHTSELQSLMRISYAVFCLKKKKYNM